MWNKVDKCNSWDKSGSSGHSRLLRKEQAQDRLFQDVDHAPMHKINDDQYEEHEEQSHDEEAQESIQRQQDVPHSRVGVCGATTGICRSKQAKPRVQAP